MYFLHPSGQLNKAFNNKPYQGAIPEAAKYLFIGLDANYDRDIESSKAFSKIIEYLRDGVTFWKMHGVHHPFLLPTYKGDGQFYHKSFSRIGLKKEHAENISFIELVDKPTFGKSSLDVDDLNINHLTRIKNIIEEGGLEYVFIPASVGKLMKRTGMFPWLPSSPKVIDSPLKLWSTLGSTQILWHYHFSVYGKFEKIKSKQLEEIGRLIKNREVSIHKYFIDKD